MPQLVDNRYRIVRTLGSGGMAEVYLAHDDVLDRDVALKILSNSYSGDEEFVERFRREAQSAAALSHPNIVSIYDRGETDDEGSNPETYYIAMEYLPGGSLKDRINSRGALPARTAAEVALQIAEALRAAHNRDVVHRDIKPHNILVTESGDLKVTDFGIARAATSSTMTRTGSVMGTAHYISPEQAMGDPAGPQSDLYSLGVVLYEMLTGELPFDAETPIGIAMKHVNEFPAPPGELDPSIPDGLAAITLRLMSKEPEERYPDESELIQDLENVVGGYSPSGATTEVMEALPPARAAGYGGVGYGSAGYSGGGYGDGGQTLVSGRGGPGGKRRRRRLLPLLLLAFLVLLALGGWAAYSMTQQASQSPKTPKTPTAQVPKLEGLSLKDARNRVGEDFGIKVSERRDSKESKGTILKQSPSAGSKQDKGSEISVVVSGQQIADVPDVVGKPRDEAESKLKDAGFSVNVKKQESSTGDEGDVTSQSPKGGKEADAKSEVTITVGSGPSTVQTPDLSGMTVSEATSVLSGAGLELGKQQDSASSEVAAGGIISQTPSAGSDVDPGGKVDVNVSTGPAAVTVPSLYGYGESNAKAKLDAAGLKLGQVKERHTTELSKGLIVSQSLAGGATAQPGTAIDVTISSGPAPVTVPDVIGSKIIDAQRKLGGMGLGYATQGIQSVEPAGTVLSTDPAAGTDVTPGTQIAISYSLGAPEQTPAPQPTSSSEQPAPAPAPQPSSGSAQPAPAPQPAPTPQPDGSSGGGGSSNSGGSDGGNNGNGKGDGNSSGSGGLNVKPPKIEKPKPPKIEKPKPPNLPGF